MPKTKPAAPPKKQRAAPKTPGAPKKTRSRSQAKLTNAKENAWKEDVFQDLKTKLVSGMSPSETVPEESLDSFRDQNKPAFKRFVCINYMQAMRFRLSQGSVSHAVNALNAVVSEGNNPFKLVQENGEEHLCQVVKAIYHKEWMSKETGSTIKCRMCHAVGFVTTEERQLRSADEGMQTVFKCKSCQWTWTT